VITNQPKDVISVSAMSQPITRRLDMSAQWVTQSHEDGICQYSDNQST